MADIETRINTIKMKDLPESSTLSDSDIILKDDNTTTNKFTLETLIQFIKNHSVISNFFVHQSTIDKESGIAPLDADRKIPSDNINFGKTNGTVFQGSEGAALETTVNTHIADTTMHLTESERNVWNDKYTKIEIDNKFSAFESSIDWKESVNTFAEIATKYPIPEDGWTVNVKDTDYTYRYNGIKWIIISANVIPKATQSVDGLLTKEDKINYDDANNKKHNHLFLGTLNKLSETDGVLMFDGEPIQVGGSEYSHPKPQRINTNSTQSPTYGGTFTVVDSLNSNIEGHVIGINTKTITVPPVQTNVSGSSGSCTGNAATATRATNDALGNEIINQKTSSTEPKSQKVGDYWLLEY